MALSKDEIIEAIGKSYSKGSKRVGNSPQGRVWY